MILVKIIANIHCCQTGVILEDPRTEELNQEVRGFIFSKLLVCILWVYMIWSLYIIIVCDLKLYILHA